MKILKYFSLLFLLTLVSLVVFILTQNGQYKVSKKIIVEAPKEYVFNYLQNVNNWKEWTESRHTNNSKIEVELNGFRYSELHNNKAYQQDSLIQTLLTRIPTKIKWTFKEIENKTEINFLIEGTIDLRTKVEYFWEGNPTQTVARAIEKDLSKLSTTLTHQYSFTEFETQGPTTLPKTLYIYVKQSSTIHTLEKDIQKHYPLLQSFVTDYKLSTDLRPMLLFNSVDFNDTLNYRLALPISKKIFLNEEDYVTLDSITSPLSFKSIATGHYKHLEKALNETQQSFVASQIQEDKKHMSLLLLDKSILDSHNPSEWKTEIYIPIIVPAQTDTISQNTNRILER